MRQGPLAGRYPAAAALVVAALVPYLALAGALQPISPIIAADLHTSAQTMSIASGMANAGYAAGTVLAIQLALLLPQRRMLLVYGVLLVVGSVLAASASNAGMFIAGHIVQGLCTSLLLIAAVPPLILGYGSSKLRPTALILNLGIFGAVALGPVIGGIQAQAGGWRPLFWVVAGIAVVALVLSVLTFQDAPPADPAAPRDFVAISLAAAGCAAAFFGSAQLLTHRFLNPIAIVLLLGGLALIVGLVVYEYRARRPLLGVRSLVSTIPVAAITLALCAAAATSAIGLTASVLGGDFSPVHLGLLFLPEFGAAVLTAGVFATVIRTRAFQFLPLAGMLSLAAGIVLLGLVVPPTQVLTLIGSGLVGIGIGASVAPALFVAGYSQQSGRIQRVFAIVELMRAVAAFMVAPILVHVALTLGGSRDSGTSIALWVCFGLAVAGAFVAVYLYVLGRARPQAPDIERWFGDRGPAWYSPPLLAGVRGDSTERALAERLAEVPASSDGRSLQSRLARAES